MNATEACLAAVAIAALTPGCASVLRVVRKPEVRRVRPRVAGIDFRGVDLAFRVDVYNPYPFPIKAPFVSYGIDIGDAEFVKSDLPLDVVLPARSVGRLVVLARMSYAALWRAYRSLEGAREAGYRLHGTVRFEVMGEPLELPLSYADRFPVLRAPRFSDVKFRLADASLRGAKLTIEAAVTNPNIFEVGIEKLGYDFEVGEVRLAGISASTAKTIGPDQTGRIVLVADVAAGALVVELLKGERLGKPRLVPSGTITTPYGTVRLQR